mmetsp:Transcript_4588/g.29071  ORF Transcript_4588/g.29071 Transcript_4588/m.29071 type:complete len:612 (-) Transcript_4588:1238-3073(-)
MDVVVKHGLSKMLVKGEDAHAVELQGRISCEQGKIELPYTCFGIFDGHGGKQASRFCAKHAVEVLQEELEERLRKDRERSESVLPNAPYVKDWTEEEKWIETASRVAALALKGCFERLDHTFNEKQQPSGCTGTLALQVGWSLAVASVGDSLALVDVAHEVLQISGDHRLDRSTTERERVLSTGDVIARSALPTDDDDVSAGNCSAAKSGKGVGPLRVWPGGLAMSRTIGDAAAGKSVIPTPEVRQITIPKTGCRMIVASDGLWDAMSLKAAANAARGSVPTTAAGLLVKGACKARGQRDDVTVIVVDFIPPGEKKLAIVVSYTKEQQRFLHHSESNVHIQRPLVDPFPEATPMGLHVSEPAPELGMDAKQHLPNVTSVKEVDTTFSEFHRSAVEACHVYEDEIYVQEDHDGDWIPAVQKHSSQPSKLTTLPRKIASKNAVAVEEAKVSNEGGASLANATTVDRREGDRRRRKHYPAKIAGQRHIKTEKKADKERRRNAGSEKEAEVDGRSKSQGSSEARELHAESEVQVEKFQELSLTSQVTRGRVRRSKFKPKGLLQDNDVDKVSRPKDGAVSQAQSTQASALDKGQKRFRRRQKQRPAVNSQNLDRGA